MCDKGDRRGQRWGRGRSLTHDDGAVAKERGSGESLGAEVGGHMHGGAGDEANDAVGDVILQGVDVHVDMASAALVRRVGREQDTCLVVFVERNWSGLGLS